MTSLSTTAEKTCGTCVVVSLTAINDRVTRIVCDDASSFDVPTRFVDVVVGEGLRWELDAPTTPAGVFVVLNAHPYQSSDEFAFFSAGGLLCKLRGAKIGTPTTSSPVTISCSKSRRRARSARS